MTQPSNTNFLLGLLGFSIGKLPTTNFFIQSANIPGITGGQVRIGTPFKNYPVPGDRLEYDNLSITFLIDENLESWLAIRAWLIGLNFPNNYEQYRTIKGNKNTGIDERFSDATLQIFSSNNVLKKEVRYKGLFPTSLSEIRMNTTEAQVTYLPATATFAFIDCEIVSMS